MRILIGYDGSECAESAFEDLKRAGLPETAEVCVLSVAEVWLPPSEAEENRLIPSDSFAMKIVKERWAENKHALAEIEAMAKKAASRLERNFPNWQICAEGTYGSPAWEILQKAEEFRADLIVVGSHGRSALGRLFLGSISNKVLTEAKTSVRVARGKIEVDPVPSRIVIGYDGTKGAEAAVEAVASRNWRKHSEVHLIAVTNPISPTAFGSVAPSVLEWIADINASEYKRLKEESEAALKKLETTELKTSLKITAGNPKNVLVEEAAKLNADSIFVGANAYAGALDKFLVGSVSAAVAARASCSVEVVRLQQN